MLSIENGNLRPVNLCVKTPSTPISPPPAYPEISRPRNDNDTSSPLRIEISKSPTTALYLLLESVSIDFNSPFPNFDRIETIRSRTLATSELSNLARTFPTATSTSSPNIAPHGFVKHICSASTPPISPKSIFIESTHQNAHPVSISNVAPVPVKRAIAFCDT